MNHKNLLLTISTFGFIIITVLLSAQNNQSELYVISTVGIRLRQAPNSSSPIISSIPYRDKVNFIESTDKKEIIGSINGKWIKVSWNNKSGYVFDGFLRPRENQDNDPFIICNMIKYSKGADIANNYFSYDIPFEDKWPKTINLSMFTVLPYLIPGDDIIVINQDYVIREPVLSLLLYNTQNHFGLQFTHKNNKGDYLCIDKSFIYSKGNKLPRIIRPKIISDISKAHHILKKYFSLKDDNNEYLTIPTDSDQPSINNLNAALKHYTPVLQDFRSETSSDNILALTLKHKQDSDWDYLIITKNNKLLHSDHSKILFMFELHSMLYFYSSYWGPRSCQWGKSVSKIGVDKLHLIKSGGCPDDY